MLYIVFAFIIIVPDFGLPNNCCYQNRKCKNGESEKIDWTRKITKMERLVAEVRSPPRKELLAGKFSLRSVIHG
jgi:hypothetical protein